ncbi:MAG: choice-of-anchor L domain-containing protein [Nonlabens sp.]
MNKRCIYSLIVLSLSMLSLNGQQIAIDSSSPVDELVNQSLLNDCVGIESVEFTGSLQSGSSFTSIAGFNNDNNNFPFTSGMVISTGNVNQITGVPNSNNMSAGDSSWGGDADLESAIGITNTLNSSILEFDFTSATNSISFNYLLASEEYQQDFPCNVSDAFAILIKPVGSTAPYQNIAVLPDNTPVQVQTIRTEVVGLCEAENEDLFAGYNLGATNFKGRTVPLTATASVTAGTRYHLKMVIADDVDFRYDTAVFIEAGSFNSSINLGDILTSCTPLSLDANVGNPAAIYEWYVDNTLIAGVSSSNYTATTSGNYSVTAMIPLDNSTCIINDSVSVTIDPDVLEFEVSDLQLCENTGAIDSRIFDLADLKLNVLENSGFSNSAIEIYSSRSDAIAGVNPLPDNYRNIADPQIVYTRITDEVTGCYGIQESLLIIDSSLIANDVQLDLCDFDNDGQVNLDLFTVKRMISDSGDAVAISYYQSLSDALAESDPLEWSYTASNNTTLIARIDDVNGDCFTTSEITIDVVPTPVLLTNELYLDACDSERDGFALFDLESLNSEFADLSIVESISYHLTRDDAIDSTNPIANTRNYQNQSRSVENVYVRFNKLGNECPAIATLTLYTNYLISESRIRDEVACDDITDDGFEIFDFQTIKSSLLNNLEQTDVQFFENESDRDSNINPIDITQPYINRVNPQIIYIFIANEDCVEKDLFELRVAPYFGAPLIPNQTYCDEDQDLRTILDLSRFDANITQLVPNSTVDYYLNEVDAQSRINAIETFANTSDIFQLYAVITNQDGCTDHEVFTISMLPAPVISNPLPIELCDLDGDGFMEINLLDINSQITTIPSHFISYHKTEDFALAGVEPISNLTRYAASTSTLYIRVTSSVTGCPSFSALPITINTRHVIEPVTDLVSCEDDGNDINIFYLQDSDDSILRGTAKLVSYYETAADAQSQTNVIDKSAPYTNTRNPQNIFYRVENSTSPECPSYGSFVIRVEDLPVFNPPQNLSTCDDDNDGFATFELGSTQLLITDSSSQDLSVSFHTSFEAADSGTNELPETYNNIVNPQIIYTRVETSKGCHVVETFRLEVIDSPIINDVDPSFNCLELGFDPDEVYIFDLTSREEEMIGPRSFETVFSWHIDEDDAFSNNGELTRSQATAFETSLATTTVYLRLFNTISGCLDVQPLELRVIEKPALLADLTYSYCETANSRVDLIDAATAMSLNSPNSGTYQYTFYTSISDAQDDVDQINSVIDYGNGIREYVVKATVDGSSCITIEQFTIIVNPNPAIPGAGILEATYCDVDNNGVQSVFTMDFDSIVLGGLNEDLYIVDYYYSLEDLNTQTNRITDGLIVTNSSTLYTQVTNLETSCTSSSNLFVQLVPVPEFEIERDQFVCEGATLELTVNGLTANQSIRWSTGETTSNILVNEPGDYEVTITNPNGCETSASTTVRRSSQAVITDVEVESFSQNNSVRISIEGTGNYRYALNDGELQRESIFYNVPAGIHQVEVVDLNGCGETVQQDIVVLDYPRFFTPNGDGYNDTWQIKNIEQLRIGNCNIYNRHGRLVASLDANNPDWDGFFENKLSTNDDYWFTVIVEIDSRPTTIKGHFSVRDQ